MVASFAVRSVLGAAILVAGTSPVAYQDLGSLLVNQPGVAERARSFLLSSPLSALRTATFSLPNPLGAAIPRLPVPDHFQVIHASLSAPAPAARRELLDFEPAKPQPFSINRALKGDREAPSPMETVELIGSEAIAPAGEATAPEADDFALEHPAPEPHGADFAGTIALGIDRAPRAGEVGRVTHLLFGADETELPRIPFEHRPLSPVERLQLASLPDGISEETISVAPKGVVTGEDATHKTPAERLGLAGEARRKAEKCLADAVYFESRGEVERGQVAVAQVVVNRVFSGYYPEDVCGTVYQNAHRHLACQFTFACEGKKLVVNDQRAWARATRIARDMLDGKLWLDDVGKATHYHANWVKPWWVREMRTIERIGVHTFYYPRRWEEAERVATGS